jgi:sulfite exporter TauE/SafE
VLAATGTGSSGAGALLLVAFFLGTLPALIAVAIGSSVLARPAPRVAHLLKAAALVSAGIALLYFRADPPCCNHGS